MRPPKDSSAESIGIEPSPDYVPPVMVNQGMADDSYIDRLREDVRDVKTQLNTACLLLCILAQRAENNELRFSHKELTNADHYILEFEDSPATDESIYRSRRMS